MKLINMTPHTIHLYDGETLILELEPSGVCPRLSQREVPVEASGLPVPLVAVVYGDPEPLPPPQPGVGYVVSHLYASALQPPRADVFVPADVVRDDEGRIIGSRKLSTLASIPAQGDRRVLP
jgi:hypothetical protein